MGGMEIGLKGAVYEKFGNMSRFASAIGWSGRKTRDIVSGRQVPTSNDIERMSDCLEIDNASDFVRIFFTQQSTKWTA